MTAERETRYYEGGTVSRRKKTEEFEALYKGFNTVQTFDGQEPTKRDFSVKDLVPVYRGGTRPVWIERNKL